MKKFDKVKKMVYNVFEVKQTEGGVK